MKKNLVLFASIIVAVSMTGCSKTESNTAGESNVNQVSSQESEEEAESAQVKKDVSELTLEDYFTAFSEAELPITDTVIFDAETDPNGNLGRPGNYNGKGDFQDSRAEQYDPDTLTGGTIETFDNKEDCDSRFEYLSQFIDASLGAFGLNQYMYKGDYAILRVSYDLTPEQAAEYEAVFNGLND